jgi:hypothetical protein
MKRALIAVLLTTVLTATAPAADKPNFSGEWKMDAAKSDFGQLPAPTSFVRKIAHAADLIATTALDSAGLKFTDKMSLSSDRKLLTSKIKIATPQGDADLTVVFERQ